MKPLGLFLSLALLVSSGTASAEPEQLVKPNIIIFYVDDLGWQDVQLNELDEPCPYETPNLVKLASQGMSFSQAYSPAPSCSPSRAGIISGQHPAQIDITHVDLGKVEEMKDMDEFRSPFLNGHLDLKHLTIAHNLKANGYKTGHVGKWHVGLNAANYGFDYADESRGAHRGMNDRTKDFATAKDKKYPLSKEKYAPFSDKKPDGISYPYDEVTESALRFMEESKEEPFFLNLWHWMVHWPVLTRNGELLEHYCDKLGHPFPPKPGDMKLEGQQNPYFASMVTTVDWSLGRLMTYLDKTDDPRNPGKKLRETTYIFFSSDNGGAELKGKEIISDNYPLKNGKTHSEEGGVRVPMVVTGPQIPAASTFGGLVNQLDYFPTIIEVTDSTIADEDKALLSGCDISPVLSGSSELITNAAGEERTHVFWHYPHSRDRHKSGLRKGDYKFYKNAAGGLKELYRLYKDGEREDIEEKNNLINNPEYADVAKELSALLDSTLASHNAQGPYLNPTFKEKAAQPAVIAESSLSGRQAKLSIKPDGTRLTEAYIIYLPASPDEVSKAKKDKTYVEDRNASQIRIKTPASVSEDGLTVTADLPEDVVAYRFILIDSENFMQYAEVQSAE